MCGIAGYFNYNKEGNISEQVLKCMLEQMSHRGPDESGIYIENDVGLAHARLSIIDLKSGQQPMMSHDKRFLIIFNGEIFNYIELKEELKKKGKVFNTTSDTEVLLNLYITYGPDCLHKLNGQFSFAIWDKQEKVLFLARDRVGIRPLFYALRGGTIIFGSEIKTIIEHPSVEPQISPTALSEVFTFWTTLTPNTVFKDIFELSPGHYMKVSRKGHSIHKY